MIENEDDGVLQKIRSFAAYLCDLKGPTGIPKKSDIDPIKLGELGLLPMVWLVEHINGNDFRYRIAGETIIHAFAQPIRGRVGSELFDPDAWDQVYRRWRSALDKGKAYFNRSAILDPQGYQHYGARFAVPLANAEGHPEFLIGLTVYGRITKVSDQSTAVKIAGLEPTFFDLSDYEACLGHSGSETV